MDGGEMYRAEHNFSSLNDQPQPHIVKKKRNQPCQPDPEAEVIAYSPKTLLSTNRFLCEICNKGFQRDQNLQLHRRWHNLPWKLKKRTNKEAIKKKVYVCPEISCAHHDPSRALGDLIGLKKHFFRKHGEKKWTCDKCPKRYAVQSDWKAHAKICGTREYRCECGKLFPRKDSFLSHKGFCDASVSTTSHHMIKFRQTHHSDFNPFPLPINGEQQNLSTLSPELPYWIAYTTFIGLATPMHQTTQSQSLFPEYFHPNFSSNHHNHNDHNPNPTPTTLPFYSPLPPDISVTTSPASVFIKPHQTHAFCGTSGVGVNFSTNEFFQSLGSYGVKADTVTGGSTKINTKEGGSDESGEGVNDELTRDFWALMSLFQSDYPNEYNWCKGLFEEKC